MQRTRYSLSFTSRSADITVEIWYERKCKRIVYICCHRTCKIMNNIIGRLKQLLLSFFCEWMSSVWRDVKHRKIGKKRVMSVFILIQVHLFFSCRTELTLGEVVRITQIPAPSKINCKWMEYCNHKSKRVLEFIRRPRRTLFFQPQNCSCSRNIETLCIQSKHTYLFVLMEKLWSVTL